MYLISISVSIYLSLCISVNITGDKCENGQAAFYYSQGCFIGCSECDHMSGRRQTDLCGNGMKPTLPNEFRSVNLDAEPGSDLDIYKHNPWRAPGNAPVASACGLAGGTPWLSEVGEAGDYTNGTILPNGEPTHHGLDGVELPPMDTGNIESIHCQWAHICQFISECCQG